MTNFTLSALTAVWLAAASPLAAAQLAGPEAEALLAGGLRFHAGSVLTVKNGKYKFAHSNSSESGQLRIDPDGIVHLLNGNGKREISTFVIDIKGKNRHIKYLSGPYKGQTFTF